MGQPTDRAPSEEGRWPAAGARRGGRPQHRLLRRCGAPSCPPIRTPIAPIRPAQISHRRDLTSIRRAESMDIDWCCPCGCPMHSGNRRPPRNPCLNRWTGIPPDTQAWAAPCTPCHLPRVEMFVTPTHLGGFRMGVAGELIHRRSPRTNAPNRAVLPRPAWQDACAAARRQNTGTWACRTAQHEGVLPTRRRGTVWAARMHIFGFFSQPPCGMMP